MAVLSARGIVTLKLAEQGGKWGFTPGWTSRDIGSPVTPLVINGVLFASSGGTRTAPAVLCALDAVTGKELWSRLKSIGSTVRGGLSGGQGNRPWYRRHARRGRVCDREIGGFTPSA